MIKSELSRQMSVETGLDKATTLMAINSIMKVIVESISKGEIVQIVGFGTFVAKKRRGRVVTIPLTNSKVTVPTAKTIKFIAGKRFIESVDKKRQLKSSDARNSV